MTPKTNYSWVGRHQHTLKKPGTIPNHFLRILVWEIRESQILYRVRKWCSRNFESYEFVNLRLWKFGTLKIWNIETLHIWNFEFLKLWFFCFQDPLPLNIPTPTPAPDHHLGGHGWTWGTRVVGGYRQFGFGVWRGLSVHFYSESWGNIGKS